jgi:exodeoxyribonuclease-3
VGEGDLAAVDALEVVVDDAAVDLEQLRRHLAHRRRGRHGERALHVLDDARADAFPALTFEALGYETFHHGQGQWNGVAILSRVGLENPIGGFGDGADPDQDARIAWATCAGVRVASCYVPNGRSLDHEHYQYKLRWLDRLAGDLDGQCDPRDDVVVMGDYNICPADIDCWDPKKFETETHTSQAERDKLAALEAVGSRRCLP